MDRAIGKESGNEGRSARTERRAPKKLPAAGEAERRLGANKRVEVIFVATDLNFEKPAANGGVIRSRARLESAERP